MPKGSRVWVAGAPFRLCAVDATSAMVMDEKEYSVRKVDLGALSYSDARGPQSGVAIPEATSHVDAMTALCAMLGALRTALQHAARDMVDSLVARVELARMQMAEPALEKPRCLTFELASQRRACEASATADKRACDLFRAASEQLAAHNEAELAKAAQAAPGQIDVSCQRCMVILKKGGLEALRLASLRIAGRWGVGFRGACTCTRACARAVGPCSPRLRSSPHAITPSFFPRHKTRGETHRTSSPVAPLIEIWPACNELVRNRPTHSSNALSCPAAGTFT